LLLARDSFDPIQTSHGMFYSLSLTDCKTVEQSSIENSREQKKNKKISS
jgi:hypothetical protein